MEKVKVNYHQKPPAIADAAQAIFLEWKRASGEGGSRREDQILRAAYARKVCLNNLTTLMEAALTDGAAPHVVFYWIASGKTKISISIRNITIDVPDKNFDSDLCTEALEKLILQRRVPVKSQKKRDRDSSHNKKVIDGMCIDAELMERIKYILDSLSEGGTLPPPVTPPTRIIEPSSTTPNHASFYAVRKKFFDEYNGKKKSQTTQLYNDTLEKLVELIMEGKVFVEDNRFIYAPEGATNRAASAAARISGTRRDVTTAAKAAVTTSFTAAKAPMKSRVH